jgi:hypothetical protein
MRILIALLLLATPLTAQSLGAPVTPAAPIDPFGVGSPVTWGVFQNAQLGPPPGHTLWATGAYPAGAISQQTLPATSAGGWAISGYVVWRITNPRDVLVVSLGNAAWPCCRGSYQLRLANGVLAVQDGGIVTTTMPTSSGDVAGIANNGGLLWYVLNGKTLYVSPLVPTFPLKVFVELTMPNATATQVYVSPTFQ